MSLFLTLEEYSDMRLLEELYHRARMRDQGKCDYCERPGSEPACRFPDRHRLALKQPEEALSDTNPKRKPKE